MKAEMAGYQCTECASIPNTSWNSTRTGKTNSAARWISAALARCYAVSVTYSTGSSPIFSVARIISLPILPRSFYARPTVEVARALLGKILVHCESTNAGENEHIAAGRIVETEAYLGTVDPAAHAYRGMTPRTRVLFGPAGHAYVYLIYGMHYCLNVSCEKEGSAGCVLLRAIEPVTEIAAPSGSGPGRLTRALGITLKHNGGDVTRGPITIRETAGTIFEAGLAEPFKIGVSPRIGIAKAKDLPLRFFIAGNAHVSRGG